MRVSRVSLFLFGFIYNMIFIRGILVYFYYNSFGNMALIYSIITLGLVIAFISIIPRGFFDFNYYKSYCKSKIRYLFNIIFCLDICLVITYGVTILNKYFVRQIIPFFLILFILYVVFVLGKNKLLDIVKICTVFGILSVFISLFCYVYFIECDLSLLLPIKFNDVGFILFGFIMLIGNNLVILFLNDDSKFNKVDFLGSMVLGMLLLIFELFILMISTGDIYLISYDGIGYFSLGVNVVAKYVGNFDFVAIILIVIGIVFKGSYLFRVIKENENFKCNFWLLFILLFCLILNYFFNILEMLVFMGIILILEFLLIIWFIYEAILNVKKTSKL